jgi:glycosyltransferase involved in cell wall biosynthesis
MKEDKVKISVVVPVYNSDTYIESCIKALLSQNYPVDHYEIIMVDNNSNDYSPEIIKRYPDIKYLKRNKQGSYAARNKGILEAKGEIIAFTDADCAPSVDWLRNIEDSLLNPEINVILGSNRFASDTHILSMLTGYEAEKAAYAFSGDDETIYYGYTNNMAIRKKVFNRLGLFLEITRGADTIFVRRVVDGYSCDTVRYFSNINVRHLEISNQYAYFQKQYIYGKSFMNYNKIISTRALTIMERLKIFKATCKTNHYSLTKSCLLFFILIIGGIYYDLGRSGV